jgi:RES domain-containing protein
MIPLTEFDDRSKVWHLDCADQWWHLVEQMETKSRYPSVTGALKELISHCVAIVSEVPPDTILFRTRLHSARNRNEKSQPLTVGQMWEPPPSTARGGRLNPSGIPYLYTAFDPETAVSEMRPWPGAEVTVARFRVRSSLLVYDLTSIPNTTSKIHKFVRKMVANAFATPTHPESAYAYGFTQTLSELLKAHGSGNIAGIQYPSAMRSGGINLALFGGIYPAFTTVLDGIDASLHTIDEVSVTTRPS